MVVSSREIIFISFLLLVILVVVVILVKRKKKNKPVDRQADNDQINTKQTPNETRERKTGNVDKLREDETDHEHRIN